MKTSALPAIAAFDSTDLLYVAEDVGGGSFSSKKMPRTTLDPMLVRTTGGPLSAAGGTNAGAANTGAQNTFFGFNAGESNTTGIYNSFFGYRAGRLNTTANRNTFFGTNAGRSQVTASGFGRNTFVGFNAGAANTDGFYNSFFGSSSGVSNTTGSYNVFFGRSTGQSNTTGSRNMAIGDRAGGGATTGTDRVAIGASAGRVGNNSFVTFIGTRAGENNLGNNNVLIGFESALLSTTADNNTAIGAGSLSALLTGDNNIAIGFQVANNLTSGSSNVFIGYDIDAPSATGSNQMSIGNLIFGTGVDGTGTTVSSGNIGIAVVTPTSGLHLGRSFATPYREITATDTFAATDYTINATSGTFTLNLPTAVGITGRIYVAKNSGAGVVTLDGAGGELIDGLATQAIASGASLTVQSTGAGWIII